MCPSFDLEKYLSNEKTGNWHIEQQELKIILILLKGQNKPPVALHHFEPWSVEFFVILEQLFICKWEFHLTVFPLRNGNEYGSYEFP